MSPITRNIQDIVETLEYGVQSNPPRKCTLLIGAGCSVSAGIPTAAGFVKYIGDNFPEAYRRAEEKNYQHLMAQLSPGQRRDIIADYVDEAKLNWAHLGMAQLIKAGYVDRILTTNFDPLVVRAAAMVDEFPAIYDFAASQDFKPADIPEKAVFHLHGQRSGFKLLHTEDEMDELSSDLVPVFRDAGRGRTWIVVGYSGESDPVFDHLANVNCYDHNFYWVAYKDNQPGEHVREELLIEGKQAFLIEGYDADGFFVELSKQLDCFPPDLIGKPFSHLRGLLAQVSEFPFPGEDAEFEAASEAQEMVYRAIKRYEEGEVSGAGEEEKESALASLALKAREELLEGNYQKVIELVSNETHELSAGLINTTTWAYILEGNTLSDLAEEKEGEVGDELFEGAYEKYGQALEIKPDKHEALVNWGAALSEQAKRKVGEEADRLFEGAYEKCRQALEIKPDSYEALNNWGATLSEQAKRKVGEEADRLFEQADEKYGQALEIKPDSHDALYNWGLALSRQMRQKAGEEADRLFEQANEKYGQALEIKPDKHEALSNWGAALFEQAKRKMGEEADRLFEQAYEKYGQALEIKPDKHEALNNWGAALFEQAKRKMGEEADRLFEQAYEKYGQVLEIKPDKHEALSNWGAALFEQAKRKMGEETDRLFEQAYEKYGQALEIKPDYNEALSNWGVTLSEHAKRKMGEEADRLFEQAYEKYGQALEIKPDYNEALSNWGATLSEQAKRKMGEEADRLFEQAYEKYGQALEIKPDYNEALSNWGATLSEHAKRKVGEEADRLFEQAYEKFEKAHNLFPEGASYNLACYYSMTRDIENAQESLEKCLEMGVLPSLMHLESDDDLNNLRELDWFKEFLEKVAQLEN